MKHRWPALVLALVTLGGGAACGLGTAASPSPSPSRAATYETFTADACAAFEALFRAYGNPDTASRSELMQSLDTAVEAQDLASAERFEALIGAEIAIGRQHAAAAGEWAPAAPAMDALDRVLTAFGAMADAKVEQVRNPPGPDPQQAFEAAGGLEAWTAMLQSARGIAAAVPPGATQRQCEGIPVSF